MYEVKGARAAARRKRAASSAGALRERPTQARAADTRTHTRSRFTLRGSNVYQILFMYVRKTAGTGRNHNKRKY